VQQPPSAGFGERLHGLAPGIIAASSFACADVLSKVCFDGGVDVITLQTVRSLIGIAVMIVWLRIGKPPAPFSARDRWIAMGLGVLFGGLAYGLFMSIALTDVPTAVLTYFVYPLLTGIVGALTGIDRLGWRGAAAALVAFIGLAMMIGAHPGHVALAGIAFAVGAACCRTAILLITRATLTHADARLTTWYSLLSSSAIFVALSAVLPFGPPQTIGVWLALIGVGVTATVSVLLIFVSVARIGPVRTALIMNLEPLLATILSVVFLGQILAPLQAIGGAIMLAALVAFQFRR
jgi:drug/metabolite transporter (DMT)-like permease